MRALTSMTLLAISLASTDARAGNITCTCIAADRTCHISWGKNNSSRNVAHGTVIAQMDRQVGKISGGGDYVMYVGPFAAESYGDVLKPGEVPPQQQVRIHGEDNLRKWRCVQEAPSTPPPSTEAPAAESIDVTTEDAYSRRPLYRAAQSGDEVLVRKMIAAGAAVRDKDVNGDTAMHAAVRHNHVPAVKFLIEAGADPNEISGQDDGRTPLQVAVDKRSVDMVGQLLAQGARPTEASMWSAGNSGMLELIEPQLAKGGDGQVVLGVLIDKKNDSTLAAVLTRVRPGDGVTKKAAESGRTAVIEQVLEAGGNATVVLDHAMNNKNASMASLALANGAKPGDWLGTAVTMQDQGLVNAMLDRGASAQSGMMASVNTGQVGMARLLLDHGASAKPGGLIAVASSRADLPMATLLLDAGANPNGGMEPAIKEGHRAIVRLLLDRGADGKQAGHMSLAAAGGRAAIVDMLLAAGGAPGPGMVPACKAGHAPVLVKLISAGGDATTRDCIVSSVKGGHTKVVSVLLQNGARTDWRVGRKDETLLHVAAGERFYDIVQALLEAGVSLDETDKNGETALHRAARSRDNVAVIDMLVKKGADIDAVNAKGKSVYKVSKGTKNNKYFKANGASK